MEPIAVTAALLRAQLPDLPLREGATLMARVASRGEQSAVIVLAGVPLTAQVPPEVQAGATLRLKVQEVTPERITLQIDPGPATPHGGETAPRGNAAPPVPAPAGYQPPRGAPALPGVPGSAHPPAAGAAPAAAHAQAPEAAQPAAAQPPGVPVAALTGQPAAPMELRPAEVRVEEAPARRRGADGEPADVVALAFTSPTLGRLDLRLELRGEKLLADVTTDAGLPYAVANAARERLRAKLAEAGLEPTVKVQPRHRPFDVYA
jgi:hypothetical protein